ncbi:retropepsin-like aspartic protease [Thermodesulfobacteriota bacterium]
MNLETTASLRPTIRELPLPNFEPAGNRVSALTAKAGARANTIETDAEIWKAFDPRTVGDVPPSNKYKAIWDTGATHSVISRKVIDECGLLPIGMARVHTASDTVDSEVFLVNIALPGNVMLPGIRVTEGVIFGHCEVLIGMDIINQGDFAFTNKDGKSTFSFRLPSLEEIDFVKEAESQKKNPS